MKLIALAIAAFAILPNVSQAANEASAESSPIGKGAPGTVSYGSIESLPPQLRASVEKNRLAKQNNYEEPLLDQDVRKFSSYQEYIRDDSTIVGKLGTQATSTDRSVLAKYRYLGLIPEGPTRAGPWTSFTRVFLRPDGTAVFLSEWDYVKDGGSIVLIRELLNERVGAIPARLVVKRSSDGTAVTELTWATPKRNFTLAVWGDVVSPTGKLKEFDKQWLIGIAERLSE